MEAEDLEAQLLPASENPEGEEARRLLPATENLEGEEAQRLLPATENPEEEEAWLLPATENPEEEEAQPLHLLPTTAQTAANAPCKPPAKALLVVMSDLPRSALCGMTGNTNSLFCFFGLDRRHPCAFRQRTRAPSSPSKYEQGVPTAPQNLHVGVKSGISSFILLAWRTWRFVVMGRRGEVVRG